MVWVKEEELRDSQHETEGLSSLQLEKISVAQSRLMALISSGYLYGNPKFALVVTTVIQKADALHI